MSDEGNLAAGVQGQLLMPPSRPDATQNQAAVAQEHIEKYQREVILHAADVQALGVVKDELEKSTKQLLAFQQAEGSATDKLKAMELSFTEQKRVLDEEIAKLTSSHADLEKQNALLHSHLESVSAQVLDAQQQSAASQVCVAQLFCCDPNFDRLSMTGLRRASRGLRSCAK